MIVMMRKIKCCALNDNSYHADVISQHSLSSVFVKKKALLYHNIYDCVIVTISIKLDSTHDITNVKIDPGSHRFA